MPKTGNRQNLSGFAASDDTKQQPDCGPGPGLGPGLGRGPGRGPDPGPTAHGCGPGPCPTDRGLGRPAASSRRSTGPEAHGRMTQRQAMPGKEREGYLLDGRVIHQ